ncbi:MAG: response regulator [Candidatus Dadabacteria bacterium]|nr:MAG: response regulator [Candidatus Dadabacteria bacterium]
MAMNGETIRESGDSVIIVDDDAATRQLFARFVERDGYRPILIDSIEELRQRRPEFVSSPVAFVDYQLEDGTGVEAVEELRRIHPEIVATLVTAADRPAALQCAERMDAFFFLTKPVPLAVFRTVLANAFFVARQRRRQQLTSLFRGSTVAWYQSALGAVRHGQSPDYRRFVIQASTQLGRIFGATGITVLIRAPQSDQWRVLTDSLAGPSVEHQLVEDNGALEALADLGAAQVMPAERLPLRAALFRHWQQQQVLLHAAHLPMSGGGVAWLLRRTAALDRFRAWDQETLEELIAHLVVLLDSGLVIQRLWQRTLPEVVLGDAVKDAPAVPEPDAVSSAR